MDRIRNVAVFGMGALGSALARRMSQADDVHVYGIVRALEAYWGAPIVVDGQTLRVNYRDIGTMADVPIDLILLCVRSYDFQEAAELIRPLVGEETILLPLTSGLGRAEQLARLYGGARVVPAAVQGMDVSRSSRFVSVARRGVLWFGPGEGTEERPVALLKALFGRCGVRSRVSGRMNAVLWKNYMLESAFGQTGLVFRLSFGQIASNERARKVLREMQRETAAVAEACGVQVGLSGLPSCEEVLPGLPESGRSRMLQDYWQNRRLETDAFCEDFCRLAREKSIPVPASSWMREQIREMTEKRGDMPVREGQIRGLSSRQGLSVTPEIIAGQLRVDIIHAKFDPGARLAENELASRFYASRSSVRSALQILAGEGLIRTLPNGRREVCRFGEKELRDLFDTRWNLERMALDILLGSSGTVYPEIAEVLGRMERKYRSQSIAEEPEDLDVLFHRSLIRSAGNMFLLNAWDSIARIWYATMYFSGQARQGSGRLLELFGRHRRLYEMILSRDGAVIPELRRHIGEEESAAAVITGGRGEE